MDTEIPTFDSSVEKYFFIHEHKFIYEETWEEIQKQIGAKSINSVQSSYSQFKNNYLELPTTPIEFAKVKAKYEKMYRATYHMAPDGTLSSTRLIRMHSKESKDPDFVLQAHGFDPEIWKILDLTNNYWQGMKNIKAGGGSMALYQSKLRVRPLTGELTLEGIDKFFEDLPGMKVESPKTPNLYSPNGLMLEIALADIHFALEPNKLESDVIERFQFIVMDIVRRIQSMNIKIEKIIVPGLGDILHFDTAGQTTTKGTQIDAKLNHQEMLKLACRMLIWAYDTLSQFAPVEAFILPGNHDKMSSYFLATALNYNFQNDPTVDMIVEEHSRTWREWGTVLLGFAHGDFAKPRLAKWLHVEAREAWGRTTWSEIHVAHKHHQITIEDNGVILRHLPTITPDDKWHYDRGFVGAQRATMSFLWDKEACLREQWYTNVR